MPRMTDRERLAKIEADQRNLANEAEAIRQSVRSGYAAGISDLPVERMSEREFRDVLTQAIRVGGPAAISALKTCAGQDGSPALCVRQGYDDTSPTARSRAVPLSKTGSEAGGAHQ